MSGHMQRTTVRLDDGLMEQAKREAARRGQTLTQLIEEGLRLALARPKQPRRKVKLTVSTRGGDLRPGIDLNNSVQLWEILDSPE
jgi:Ribbon-helix-helix protein, copG family